ncbi:winged helix-turn-helix domain-containing protein [Streptomyces sp. SPB074]|uniref:winged helix-turn-helix domain-containing protein n=1 Tax=Streptomyces sp. (strain SPB074) TaxID=465543 RepID=UPI0001D1DBE1|nr:winged helix-turn-helix domain-containing protein [Streptomyces sp. SPB074]EDY43868.2 transcriptional regulatory protein [Streptomyces sp. SPB074]
MANHPSLSATPLARPAGPAGPRHRLRAVEEGEPAPAPEVALPAGATWLPVPPHTLPALPGNPPMVGYLVLVPADQRPPFAEAAAPAAPAVSAVPAPAPAPEPRGEAVRVDAHSRTAEVDGRPLDLTYLEFELLAHLVAHPHRVHTRDQLVTTVWGYGHVGDGRTVDVHIARLRRKLGGAYRHSIQTVRRVGYKYTPPLG